MGTSVRTSCIALILFFPLLAAAEEMTDEKQILALEEEWARAIAAKDAAALDRIVAPDFTFIDPDGLVLTRAQYLLARESNLSEVHSFEASDMIVNVVGDAALVSGVSTIDESTAGTRYKYKLRWKEMWVKQGGSWRALAGQGTPVNPAWKASFAQR